MTRCRSSSHRSPTRLAAVTGWSHCRWSLAFVLAEHQSVNFRIGKAGDIQLEIDLEIEQVLELEREYRIIPACEARKLVFGEDEGSLLRRIQT